jgi:hypothetical protein
VREAVDAAAANDAAAGEKIVAATIAPWQKSLWKFNPVGQIARELGRKDGPAAWMEPVDAVVVRRELRLKPAVSADGKAATIRLVATDAGDGNEDDFVVWVNPRLVAPGMPDLPLRDVRGWETARALIRGELATTVPSCLAALTEAEAARAAGRPEPPIAELAAKHAVDPDSLAAWSELLGPSAPAPRPGFLLTEKAPAFSGEANVAGWTGSQDLRIVANASDEERKVTEGSFTIKPRGVVVHPGGDRRVVVAWRSPAAQKVRVAGSIARANLLCGSGVAWSVEVRRGASRLVAASGTTKGKNHPLAIGPIENLQVREHDRICLVVDAGPAHDCDSTAVDLVIASADRTWSLAADLSSSEPAKGILAANPHPDADGHPGVWELGSETPGDAAGLALPPGSLLARWQDADAADRGTIAAALARLLQEGTAALSEDVPDRSLHDALVSALVPKLARRVAGAPAAKPAAPGPVYGVDPAAFGRHPAGGGAVADHDLCVRAPATVEIAIPADLAAGREFVVTATMHPDATGAAAQAHLLAAEAAAPPQLAAGIPVLAVEGGPAWERFAAAFAAFRELFPPAVCYARIVPVDEGVTLNVFYREDARLRRLLLDDAEAARLDRLWEELLFVSQEPIRLEDSFEQLVQFATQVSGDSASSFAALRPAIEARVAAFAARQAAAEPVQVEAVVRWAAQAWRRPLDAAEADGLRALYRELRQDGLEHDDAVRMLLARVLVAPAFLYKLETPGPGREAVPVSGRELATRLSYFLWSTLPDEPLTSAADRLQETDVLLGETRRMLRDPRIRRLAVEFGTHWLHVHGFDAHDEKSAEAFPDFAALRGPMHEEVVLLLTDLFQNDRSILSLVDADHTFLNESLAKHYGIPNVTGPEFRRVEGVKQHGRGGVLTLAATLAKQSGASRTSPILRGTFFTEMLLGEKLPKPPKNVPPLAEAPPAGLSERELTALHSRDAACAGCHALFDGYGFALEEYDAIGRRRDKDTAGKPIDAATALPDGTAVTGAADLRAFLASARGVAFERQFIRKLLGFALGRGVQLSDEPLLDDMQAALAANGHRVSVAVEAIVQSPQFRQIRGREAGGEQQ